MMSLDVTLYDGWCSACQRGDEVFSRNITHNLGNMAVAAGIYEAVWRPAEVGIRYAGELIEILEAGISKMERSPDWFRQFDAKNGWGTR